VLKDLVDDRLILDTDDCLGFASALWANGDAIRDRVTRQLAHGIVIHRIPAQVAVFGIPFQ